MNIATKKHKRLKKLESLTLLCFLRLLVPRFSAEKNLKRLKNPESLTPLYSLRPFAAGLILLVTAAGMAFQLTPEQLPPPLHTPSANNRPQVIPQPDGAQI